MRLHALSILIVLAGGVTENVRAQTLGGSTRLASGEPIAGVEVSALNAQGRIVGTVISDSAGVFHIPLPRADRYRLRAQHLGHPVHTSAYVRVRRGESIAVDLRIGPQVAELAPLVVIGRRRHPVSRLSEFYDRMDRQKKLGLGRFITRQDIEQTSTTDVHTLLVQREPSIRLFRAVAAPAAMSPDPLQIVQNALNVRAGTVKEVIYLHRRGGVGANSPCAPLIYLDGMLLGRTENVDLTSFVSTDEIEGIEIYRSGAETPGELADGCGSIGVWTRRAVATSGNPFTLKRVGMASAFVAFALLMTR